MAIQATGIFDVKSWNEELYSEIEGQPKLSRAEVIYVYHGDIEGEGKVEYLMCYSGDNVAYFVGYEQVTGRLGDRSGSFVLQHIGTYESGAVKDTLIIVPGSGTGDLNGLVGKGTGGGNEKVMFTLNYDFA
jgi:hypothetical protein